MNATEGHYVENALSGVETEEACLDKDEPRETPNNWRHPLPDLVDHELIINLRLGPVKLLKLEDHEEANDDYE